MKTLAILVGLILLTLMIGIAVATGALVDRAREDALAERGQGEPERTEAENSNVIQ